MGPTTHPIDTEADETPRAVLFDGWGFVPLTETEAAVPPEVQIQVGSETA